MQAADFDRQNRERLVSLLERLSVLRRTQLILCCINLIRVPYPTGIIVELRKVRIAFHLFILTVC